MSHQKTAVADHLMTQSVPQVSCQQAADIALRLYGLRGHVELLQGERDLNFCLSVNAERRYMLKVINAAEPTEVSHFQTNMLLHIAQYAPDLRVPRVVITLNQLAEPVVKVNGVSLRVRLVSYLDGTPQYRVSPSVELMQGLGKNLAQLDLALQNFFHPAAHRPLLWDISHAEQVRPYLEFVDDRQQYQHISRILDRYDQFVSPRLKMLRQQTIHNDLNPHNALVNLHDPTQVAGIIDFGDALHAPLIAELATALAYQVSDGADPFEFVVPFLAAYHRQLPLTEEEIALLPDLIAARMALGITIPQWRSALYPENRDYLLRNLPQCWRGLSRMAEYSYEQCYDRFLQACQ
ncbi:phosphotransferase [Brenneria goodwinii]|uniref:phosphotransferase n=1 Tax=Brenneria goodwinii TaxID=1109412 RepID=UPI0036ED551B